MNERPEIDYLTPYTLEETGNVGDLLNENIARIELLKMRILDWPGLGIMETEDMLRELDILRGAMMQTMGLASQHLNAAQPQTSSLMTGAEPSTLKLEGIIGQNKHIAKALKIITKVAPTDLTILLEGETGSGKELFARIIHLNSNREKFVAVNCGAFPTDIIESELFGHVKGSFTGATSERKGKFEEADGGTIFLDEIGDLVPQAQVKLLRVLEVGEIQRVGSDRTFKVNVKVIAATHKNLETMVKEGDFREDLYYRINMCPIWIPPLRERRDEIGILFEHFLNAACAKINKNPARLDAELREFINYVYDFPGNIRELRNIAHYIAYIADDNKPVMLDHLPERYQKYRLKTNGEDAPEDLRQIDLVRQEAEKEYLIGMLKKYHGNIKKVCAEMHLSRSRIYQLFSKFNIQAAHYR